jgi:putative flippase GtrA
MGSHTIRNFIPSFHLHRRTAWIPPLFKFAAVGIINTGVDLGIYFLLTRYVSVLGDTQFLSKAFSYSIGVVTSYTLNRNWTFRSNTPPVHSFVPFVGVNLFSVALNAVLMFLFLEFLRFGEVFALVLVTGITFGWNFLASKYFVFTDFSYVHRSASTPITRLEAEVEELSV